MRNSFTELRSAILIIQRFVLLKEILKPFMDNPYSTLNPGPFVEALLQGEQRVAVGVDSAETEVVLFGVDAAYPMQNGDMSTGPIAAVPLEYITDFLSLEDKDQLMHHHIIRPDGSDL